MNSESLLLKIDGLDLDRVYENFIRQIAGTRLVDTGNTIKDDIDQDEYRRKLSKEIATLEKKIKNEKQFNRQVELNNELKRLKNNMEKENE